ncbi:hypothetical protein C8C77_105106 [Halanaerobium saccharolyticum]|uniref:Uncharacterized protein n=1 Tax=Halanaerobium saccharolyticum TaxID=43595 RepID=A0A4R7Z5Q7_9FIRM|nr:hypothetical protein [Halanaerobium saccharolyticum]RAK12544.1 hypothetical protein C7958_101106 [Halanaerobium saccharolyticum]TDW06470.1 hypothetical protein C8C77_105106 [Halanaerobium saccharolyticum]TDX61718.1 hypothetical protein C7956_105106 [Halanaerobium saccharolyticum]
MVKEKIIFCRSSFYITSFFLLYHKMYINKILDIPEIPDSIIEAIFEIEFAEIGTNLELLDLNFML